MRQNTDIRALFGRKGVKNFLPYKQGDLLSDDVRQEGLEQLGVTREMERDVWTIDEGSDELQNCLRHFRARRELQDVSQCWNQTKEICSPKNNLNFDHEQQLVMAKHP